MFRTTVVTTLLLFASHRLAWGELVVNGSLTGDPGVSQLPAPWTTLNNGVYIPPHTVAPGGLTNSGDTAAPDMPPSPDGGTFLVMVSNAILETSLAAQEIDGLVPGQTYWLSFYYANAGLTVASFPFEPDPGRIASTIAGQAFTTDELDYAGPGLQQWHTATFSFVATQPTEQLRLTTIGGQSWMAVDGVSIVPEPSGLVLLGAALAGWLAWRRPLCSDSTRGAT